MLSLSYLTGITYKSGRLRLKYLLLLSTISNVVWLKALKAGNSKQKPTDASSSLLAPTSPLKVFMICSIELSLISSTFEVPNFHPDKPNCIKLVGELMHHL